MATRTPLRESERYRVEPSHGLLHRAEEWADEDRSREQASEARAGGGRIVRLLAVAAVVAALGGALVWGSIESARA